MEVYILNYASYDSDDCLYSECLGVYSNIDDALNKRNRCIEEDVDDYIRAHKITRDDYDKYVIANTRYVYVWDNNSTCVRYTVETLNINVETVIK